MEVLDATHFKWEPVKGKDGRPVIDRRTGRPKVKVSGRPTMLANTYAIYMVQK